MSEEQDAPDRPWSRIVKWFQVCQTVAFWGLFLSASLPWIIPPNRRLTLADDFVRLALIASGVLLACWIWYRKRHAQK